MAVTPFLPPPTFQLKPANFKSVSKTHYAALCVYSLVCCSATLYHVWSVGQLEGSGWLDFMCTPVPDWLRLLSITFTLSKIWEVRHNLRAGCMRVLCGERVGWG